MDIIIWSAFLPVLVLIFIMLYDTLDQIRKEYRERSFHRGPRFFTNR
jgi:hypothetical protein